MLSKPLGEIITFYSFKGGTGRSMALSNVAYILANTMSEGEEVLMIDWDLEAPGLHRFFQDNFPQEFRSSNKLNKKFCNHPGLIDLFTELSKRVHKTDFGSEETEEYANEVIESVDLKKFVIRTDIPHLSLLKAGRFDKKYSKKVNTFDWVDLYNREPHLFVSFAEMLVKEYKYVLIDSRTGYTDISGICTSLMPQKLVVVFTPNRQNIGGAKEIVKRAIGYRRISDDFRPLLVYPLPTRIESSREGLRKEWRHGNPTKSIEGYQTTFERIFSEAYDVSDCNLDEYFREVQIQHSPDYAYGENISVKVEEIEEKSADRLSLSRSYRIFTEWLIESRIPWDPVKNNTDDLSVAVKLIQKSILGEHLTPDEKILSCVVSEDTRSEIERVTVTFGKKPNILEAFISLEEIQKNNDGYLLTNLLENSSLAQAFNLKTQLALGKSFHASRRPLSSIENLKELHKNTVTTTRVSEVIQRLQDKCDVALIGQSASGKTVTAAQVSTSLFMQGWTVSWLELSEPERDLTDLFLYFVRTPRGKACKHLIVLDDIQSNLRESTRIFQLISCLRSVADSSLVLLAVGWDTATNLIKDAFQNVFVISCKGEELLVPISRTFPQVNLNDKNLDRIRSISDGNLFIAKQAFRNLAKSGKVPSLQEIAVSAYKHLTANSALTRDAVRLLYQLSALGQFEIEASRAFAEDISKEGLDELLRLKIVRLNGEFLSVGHRSLSNIFVFYLYNTMHQELEDIPTPAEIAVEYLRKAGDKQILATLELLELENTFAENNPLETSFLVRVWTSFRILISYLEKRNETDPTWGDNIATAAFAANAFAELSNDQWFSTAKFIRSRWSVPNNSDLPSPLEKSTAERIDFDEIYKRMKEEDKIAGLDSTQSPGADTIDLDKFHRTWILGILLGFEGVSRKPNYKILAALKDSASLALEPDGSFYPSRVPWITARVLLGLCATGESIRSSEIVRRACNWLRRPYPEGPYREGVWESGTGTWNTNIMTTAMCVSALVRSGVPVNDAAVKGGIDYLLSKRSEWITPGKELDGAVAMEAILLVRGQWREIRQELSHILSWASNSEPWTHTRLPASETQCESAKVPQIASSLINIVWETVKTELPLLFGSMSIFGRET